MCKYIYKPNYGRLSIQDDKVGTVVVFILFLNMVNSLIEQDFHHAKVGLMFLLGHPFLCFQMHKEDTITIFVKQGHLKAFFAARRIQ
jgi:hypothetical protein